MLAVATTAPRRGAHREEVLYALALDERRHQADARVAALGVSSPHLVAEGDLRIQLFGIKLKSTDDSGPFHEMKRRSRYQELITRPSWNEGFDLRERPTFYRGAI